MAKTSSTGMDRSRVMYLISTSHSLDDKRQAVATETKRKVYCQVGSVSASEFFEAGKTGLNPQYRVDLFAPDYQGETIAELDGKRYGIYRTYQGRNETMELYLERKAGI